MEKLKNFLNKYGALLDTNQGEFFDYAEDYLSIEDYSTLVYILKDSKVDLNPETIFSEFANYKLLDSNLSIKDFIAINFDIEEIDYFNGFNIKNLDGKSISLGKHNIFAINNRVGEVEVASADLIFTYESESIYIDNIENQFQIRFFKRDGTLLTTFIYRTADIEDLFKLVKVVPDYGIGYNKVEIEEAAANFIHTLKGILGV